MNDPIQPIYVKCEECQHPTHFEQNPCPWCLAEEPGAPWMQTHTGRAILYEHFTPRDVCLFDVAYSVSRIRRFVGHTCDVDVASHSIRALEAVIDLGGDEHAQRAALFHDAHEAIIGDIPAPLKRLLPDLRKLEDRVQARLLLALKVVTSLDLSGRRYVKPVDLYLAAVEAECGFPHGRHPRWLWPADVDSLQKTVLAGRLIDEADFPVSCGCSLEDRQTPLYAFLFHAGRLGVLCPAHGESCPHRMGF